ncbi:NAD-dependent dehydratase [Gordoniibacillus kamchatkensis]|uniref:NAD-dependent dehydratase n=1 Tax=Gordoniibacillus kamchatkensis TaxID=1590651 RepID=A0ABR5ABM1_9BACL|nr:NAD-dependent epimerase/dehydratase family protein [Paenibacillus sp. VKM B-2647]KIL38456.1 NAD-dependent dehydratase [Paenibacillus sp. VKM B-2647]
MPSRPESCLITGGGGFIGYHLAQRLVSMGCEVTIIDNKGLDSGGSIGCRYLKGDLQDESLVRSLVAGHDCVYHMAALLGVRRTMESPADMLENNVAGTIHVLRAALAHGKKVLFASTSEVYGKGTPPFAESADLVFGPTQKLRWSYAVGKALEEYLCLGYAKKGLPVAIVRYFNVYGPRQKQGLYGGVVAKFIASALKGDDIVVYGDGSQTRSFTYVSDAVDATIAAMQYSAGPCVVNIGCDEEIAIADLARIIRKLAKSTSAIVTVPYERIFPDGFEEVPRRLPSILKAQQLFGYHPHVALEEGLRQTIAWFRASAAALPKEED